MPKYSVNEVLDIIKNFTPEEKLELQQSLPSVLNTVDTATKTAESHSQNIGGINIGSGNSDIAFTQQQADRGSSVNQSRTQATLQNADAQEALTFLSKLKQDITASNALNPIEKKTLEIPLQTIEGELKKPQPDKSLVEQSIEALKKSLKGVAELAEPMLKLAPLIAKVWAGDMSQEFPSSKQNISNVSIGDSNVVTFNQTQILQISVAEIKTRQFIQTSPYKGLKKFESADKDLFFGRDQFLTGLVNELEQTNLILLLGASGSGKSSVVRAGLIPWLSQKWGSRLVNLTLTPDTDPFESFYASLLSKYKQSEAQIAREAKGSTLTEVVKSLKEPDDNWFILIDQFEELFTTSLADKRDNFITSLVQLSKTKEHSVQIMATMRADFLDRLSPYPQLVKATDKHRPLIAEMQIDELRLAIEQPAAQYGVVFETGLVEEIIKDIQGQAGYLPLLQYTLNLLWDTEVQTGSINDRTLNISTYRELGGVRGALQKHVDQIYSALLEPEKLATQRIFLKLVGIGGDSESSTEWKPVRRRANRFEFNDQLEQTVLVKLINENLLVSDRQPQAQESTVEIAREILLTSWATLNNWIKENRQAIALRNRLNDDVARWLAKKTEDELWTGSKLEQVLELRKNATFNKVLGGFSETNCQFIDDSLGLRDRQLRKTRIVAGVGLMLATLATSVALLAFFLWQDAQKRSIIASINGVDALVRSDKSMESMVEAIKTEKQYKNLLIGKEEVSAQVLGALQQVVYSQMERLRLRGLGVVFSPDGKRLATSDNDIVRLWNVSSGKELAQLRGHHDEVISIVFSPDGKKVATASFDETVRLWDAVTGRELAQLRGHTEQVTSVVFSPDGKRLATASVDKTARLWDAVTGRELAQLRGHTEQVTSVVFSPDGKRLATASADKTARLWDTVTSKQLVQLRGHQNWVTSVVFSPDGKRLVTASEDKTARLWDVATGKELAQLRGHQGEVQTVGFSPDGKLVATGSIDSTARLWDVATGKELVQLRGHQNRVISVVFSPDGKLIATGSDDSTARLWDVATGKELVQLRGHTEQVTSVKFSPDGKLVATASIDSTRLWNVATGKELVQLRGHTGEVNSVVFSPDGKLVATASDDSTVRLWDVATGKELVQLRGHTGEFCCSVKFSPDGKLVATASIDSTRLWDVATGKELVQLRGHTGEFTSMVFSPDGKLVATASRDKTARLWDVVTGKELAQLRGHTDEVYSVKFSPNGKLVATASEDKTARLWDVATGKELAQLRGHTSSLSGVEFSPDGKVLATVSSDKTARLWDVATGKELAQLRGHRYMVYGVVFSPDGKRVATASSDSTARLWDVATGKELVQLRGHTDWVMRVVFSPDGKLVATASKDKTARLWNVATGKELAQLRGHTGEVNSVVFSPDGKLVATASKDKTAQLWQVGGIEELLTRSCDWVQSYLNSPIANLNESDKHLCDGVGSNK